MRVYLIDLAAKLHDLRGLREEYSIVYHNDNYSAGQHLAATLRNANSDGVAYESVRRLGGECVAVFRARLLSNCRQEQHLCYVWDGRHIDSVYEKRALGGQNA